MSESEGLSTLLFGDGSTGGEPRVEPDRGGRRWVVGALLFLVLAVAGGVLLSAGLISRVIESGIGARSAGLPMSEGAGPALVDVIGGGGSGDASIWGGLHQLRAEPTVDGGRAVAYLTSLGSLCVGEAPASGNEPPTPATCLPVGRLPDAGLTAGMSYGPSPNPPRAATVIALGLVRGQVTRVEVQTARGRIDAALVPLPDPAAGSLYWADTGLPPESLQVLSIRRVAYRGATAVFACTDLEPECV